MNLWLALKTHLIGRSKVGDNIFIKMNMILKLNFFMILVP